MGRVIKVLIVAVALITVVVRNREYLSHWGNEALATMRDEGVRGATVQGDTVRDGHTGERTVVKCITKDSVTFYNSLPADVVCDKVETIRLKPVTSTTRSNVITTATRFTCDGRQHCSQMTSCAEARFFLAHCPGVKMDGDHDGKPCERQCGG